MMTVGMQASSVSSEVISGQLESGYGSNAPTAAVVLVATLYFLSCTQWKNCYVRDRNAVKVKTFIISRQNNGKATSFL